MQTSRRSSLIPLAAALLLFGMTTGTPSIYAQDEQQDWSGFCTVDYCPAGDPAGGGCGASGNWGCISCADKQDGSKECVMVYRSAACSCTVSTHYEPGLAPRYSCYTQGTCTYRP